MPTGLINANGFNGTGAESAALRCLSFVGSWIDVPAVNVISVSRGI